MNAVTWTPGIGDPTLFGWFTVLAYGLASWVCLRAFSAEKAGPPRPLGASIRAFARVARKHFPHLPPIALRAGFWLFLALFFFALGVNKQLDLQTLFTEVGRWTVRSLGLYEMRRLLQVGFLVVLALALLQAVRWSRHLLAGFPELRLAFWGFVCQTLFILTRAISFHGIDRSLEENVVGLSLNFVFEMTGISLAMVGAVRRILMRRKEARASGPS